MYCTECGNMLSKESRYCSKCGSSLTKSLLNNKKLKKTFLLTGITSILLGLFGFISAMIIGFDYEQIPTDALVALVLNGPRLFVGAILVSSDMKNLKLLKNLSLGMFIFSLLYSVSNFLIDYSGWLYWILIPLYFKSYRDAKEWRNESQL